MLKLISRWWTHPAEPWQFWYPQSGLLGGMLLLGFILCLYELVRWVLE